MSVPRPETLVQRTVKVLQAQIAEGRFGEILPGEPRLAEQLLVSRGTVRKALGILTDQGVLSAGTPGKPRRVQGRYRSGARRGRRYRVGVIAPEAIDAMSVGDQQFLHQLEAETKTDGITFSYHHSLAIQRKRPARWLDALLAETPADLWFLLSPPIPVARYFRSSGTPAIICGGPSLNEGLSYCGYDGAAALRHAIGIFVRAGHSKIIFPSRHQRHIREQTFREELEKRGLPFDSKVNLPLWDGDIFRLRKLLCRKLDAPDRPTACILNGLDAMIALHSCLMERRMSVPDDLSVLALGSDPMFECFCPAIGYYETPHRVLARATADMIRSQLQSPSSAPTLKLLQTEYVRGGSVGSAPHSG